MNAQLIKKVLDRHQLHETFRMLSQQLNTSELTTFLSHVFASRATQIQPATLRDAISTDRFVRPSTVSPKTFHQFDAIAFDLLPKAFELIELSPLAPLGTVSALATVDPGLVVNTIRSHDVVSDCTNVLAILAASIRHELPGHAREELNYCASQRMVRAQYPQHEKHTAHFKILTLVSAGRDTGSFDYEMRTLAEHIAYYVALIRSFDTSSQVEIDLVLKEYRQTGIDWNKLADLASKSNVNFSLRQITRENWNYYSPFQFNINIRQGGDTFNLADGGMVDWTQKLLSDKKERLLISGFGTELFCKLFLS